MKIALIAPPYPLEESPSPPLGISYVAAILEAAGAEVVILDYIVRRYSDEKLARELATFGPDVVGTNAVTMTFNTATAIIKKVKELDPSIVTVMGGPHVTFDWENTLTEYPEIDVLVLGEGERTLQELLPLIRDRGDWGSVRGIAFLDNGKARRTEPRDLIADLDALPLPSRHLLPLSRYRALGFPVNIITSRGCPGRCIFCVGRRMVGKKLRNRDPALVVDEMEQVLSYGFDRINIADDCFTTNKRRVRALCNEIRARELPLTWSAFVRADTLNVECLQNMKDAGCDTVSFGVESGVPEMLKRIRKGITLDSVRRAVDYCREVGMRVFASYMVGLPGETPETLRESHRFAKSLGIEFGYHFLAPFPGTVIRDQQEEFDIQILTENWDLYNANGAITGTSHIGPEEIEQFVEVNYNRESDEDYRLALEHYRAGHPTDREFFKIEGKMSMELVFKLLAEDIIEEQGKLSLKGADDEMLVLELSRKLEKITGVDLTFVQRTVGRLFQSGCLKTRTVRDGTEWYWTHNNQVDAYPQPSEDDEN